MPPRAKKGKTININDFNDDYVPDDVYEWKDDDWTMTAEEAQKAKVEEKVNKQMLFMRRSRAEGNTLADAENFRTADKGELNEQKFSINDLEPPYVAYFGNLRAGTTSDFFLQQFNVDSVVSHSIIAQERSTFALVEFNTAHALSIALMLDQTIFRGRKMYVDIATQKQSDRLLNKDAKKKEGRSGPALSRDMVGTATADTPAREFSRDAFGDQQPTMASGNSRSNLGSRVDLSDFSRDMMGANSPTNPRPAPAASPFSGGGNWRDEAPAEQPEAPVAAKEGEKEEKKEKEERKENGAGKPPGKGAAEGGSKPPAAAKASFGNWRDEPAEQQPVARGGGGAGGERGGRGGGRGRGRGGPGSPNSNSDAKKENASSNSLDRWGDLRK